MAGYLLVVDVSLVKYATSSENDFGIFFLNRYKISSKYWLVNYSGFPNDTTIKVNLSNYKLDCHFYF